MLTVWSNNIGNNYSIEISGNDNTAIVDQDEDDNVSEIKQTGNSNDGNLSVTGDSIYDYTLNFAQNGSDSCTYSYNRNNQTADLTQTVSNGC